MTRAGALIRCDLVVEGTPLTILGETAYPPTVASARVRLINYQPFLAADGISLQYRPALTESEYGLLTSGASPAHKAGILIRSGLRASRHSHTFDLLMVHRLRLLAPIPGVDPPRAVDVYDFDDALFLGSATAVNRRFAWAKQEARRCIAYLRRARLVLAGNTYLAGVARRHARRVEVVPSCVDPDRQPLRTHGSRQIVTAGWIGSPTTVSYLEPVLPLFAAFNENRLRARLVVVGADTGVRAPWIEHRAWSLAGEAAELASFDFGVMPLPDTDWARGKCGYKLLQYFSAGVPAISSPVGVATELIGADRGLLASTQAEWDTALERLVACPDERGERGAAGRAFVERKYSYRRWSPELGALLRSVAG